MVAALPCQGEKDLPSRLPRRGVPGRRRDPRLGHRSPLQDVNDEFSKLLGLRRREEAGFAAAKGGLRRPAKAPSTTHGSRRQVEGRHQKRRKVPGQGQRHLRARLPSRPRGPRGEESLRRREAPGLFDGEGRTGEGPRAPARPIRPPRRRGRLGFDGQRGDLEKRHGSAFFNFPHRLWGKGGPDRRQRHREDHPFEDPHQRTGALVRLNVPREGPPTRQFGPRARIPPEKRDAPGPLF
mmetsp:Transcript_34290/g.110101  ORF Transcript_34290/g.110101 Transcript_34290/m.110101 type:complete len:238 (+) Transcript_34290:625-1338(+)